MLMNQRRISAIRCAGAPDCEGRPTHELAAEVSPHGGPHGQDQVLDHVPAPAERVPGSAKAV